MTQTTSQTAWSYWRIKRSTSIVRQRLQLYLLKLFKGNKELASVAIKKVCGHCGETSTLHHALVELNQRQVRLDDMQRCIRVDSYADEVDICKSCKNVRQITYTFNRMLALEVEPISRTSERTISISEISKTIQLHDKQYKLFGVTEGRKNHFVAHVNNGNYWRVFDDVNTNISRKEESKVFHMPILPYMLFYSE